MFYSILADVIMAVHLAYILYVLLGQLAIWVGLPLHWSWIRNPWFRFSHLVMICIVAVESVFNFECPLTTWEIQLEQMNGGTSDDRSFIGRLMYQIAFCQGIDFDDPAFLYVYVGFALVVLATFVLWPPRPFKGWFGKCQEQPKKLDSAPS